MKNKKILFFLIIIAICIAIAGVIYFLKNKIIQSNTEWDIVIEEHWNNPLEGRRNHEFNRLFINSKKRIAKVLYIDENNKKQETEIFKISKQNITKVLELANLGTEKNEKASEETYTLYEISVDGKTTFVDSKQDKENIISKLLED